MGTFSNMLPNSPTTSQCYSLHLSISKTHFRSHLYIYLLTSHIHLTFYPTRTDQTDFYRTDQTDFYPNSYVNRILRAREYIRLLRSAFHGRHINFNFTYFAYLVLHGHLANAVLVALHVTST